MYINTVYLGDFKLSSNHGSLVSTLNSTDRTVNGATAVPLHVTDIVVQSVVNTGVTIKYCFNCDSFTTTQSEVSEMEHGSSISIEGMNGVLDS